MPRPDPDDEPSPVEGDEPIPVSVPPDLVSLVLFSSGSNLPLVPLPSLSHQYDSTFGVAPGAPCPRFVVDKGARNPSRGGPGNHYDVETGDEFWVSGVKKDRSDRTGPVDVRLRWTRTFGRSTNDSSGDDFPQVGPGKQAGVPHSSITLPGRTSCGGRSQWPQPPGRPAAARPPAPS